MTKYVKTPAGIVALDDDDDDARTLQSGDSVRVPMSFMDAARSVGIDPAVADELRRACEEREAQRDLADAYTEYETRISCWDQNTIPVGIHAPGGQLTDADAQNLDPVELALRDRQHWLQNAWRENR